MVEQQLVHFLDRLVAILLKMLSDMEDDEDKDTGKDAKIFSNVLSAALGGDLLVLELIKLLPGYLRDSDWKKRHAALFFLKEIAKGCVEALKKNLEQIVKMMVASFKDKHPRVMRAARFAMCELLVDLKPDLEDQYHEKIFPALLQAMRFDCPHIQECTTWAAWNFMCWCSEDILKIYLHNFFDTAYTVIQTGNRVVQHNALLILGLLATLLKHTHLYVETIYKYIMPKLKHFLKAEISKADPDRRLCASSGQCIYYIGTGLGMGHFRNDAKEVMEEMMSFKGAKMEARDPATGSLLITWTRLLQCLGRDFLPCMELVMPPLLQYAQSDSELIVSSSNMDNTEVKTGKGAGEKLLDEKASACYMLWCYADELKEDFYPWIDKVARLLLPFLKIKFHKNVRKATISAMSKLLCSAKLAVQKEKPCVAVKLLCVISNSLIEAMHEEDDKELCCEMVKSLVDCISAIKILKKVM
ncbi:uncharacterized protein LOC144546690 [Carex rostrata]